MISQYAIIYGFLGLIVLGAVALYVRGLRAAAAQKVRFQQITKEYADALDYLGTNPTAPDARLRCLSAGRAFYAQKIPDTYTQHYVNWLPVGGTSDYVSNETAREARINSDIEARIGHLKVKQAV